LSQEVEFVASKSGNGERWSQELDFVELIFCIEEIGRWWWWWWWLSQ
jgi:hypothetical protein